MPKNRIYDRDPSFLSGHAVGASVADNLRKLRNLFIHQFLKNPVNVEAEDVIRSVKMHHEALLNEIQAMDPATGWTMRAVHEYESEIIMFQGFDPELSARLDEKTTLAFAKELYPELLQQFYAGISYYSCIFPEVNVDRILKRGETSVALAATKPTSTPGFINNLLTRLGENDNVAHLFRQFVETLGEEAVMNTVELAEQRSKDGTAGRSLGGDFIRLCKERMSDLMTVRDKILLQNFLASTYESWEPRKYQLEMAAQAKELGNAIVVAPTGTGKTKVISLAIEQLWEQNRSAKVVVVDTTNPLVFQMGQSLKQSCRLSGRRFGVFCGSNPIPDRDGWDGVLMQYDCLVFTPAYLTQTWERRFGSGCVGCLSQVDLLVFDECHHTDGEHPYKVVTDHYHREDWNSPGRTRVLALTATIGGACTIQDSTERISKLASTLHSRIVKLSEDAQRDLDQFTSQAVGTTVGIQLSVSEIWMVRTLQDVSRSIQFKELKVDIEMGAPAEDLLKELRSALEKSVLMVASVGVAKTLSLLAKNYLSSIARIQVPMNLLYVVRLKLMLSKLFSPVSEIFGDEHQISISPEGFFTHAITSTQRELVQRLDDLAYSGEFKGILFFRTVCGVETTLSLLLDDPRGLFCEEDFEEQIVRLQQRLRPLKLLGVQHMTHTEQMAHVEQFREGACNLLLCTSVGEEGLDFPACNVVICVDGVVSDITLRQCRGRARAANGNFVVFVQESPDHETQSQRLAIRSTQRETNAALALTSYLNSPESCRSPAVSSVLEISNSSFSSPSVYPSVAFMFDSPAAHSSPTSELEYAERKTMASFVSADASKNYLVNNSIATTKQAIARRTSQLSCQPSNRNWVGCLNEYLVKNKFPALIAAKAFSLKRSGGSEHDPIHTLTLEVLGEKFKAEGRRKNDLKNEAAEAAFVWLSAKIQGSNTLGTTGAISSIAVPDLIQTYADEGSKQTEMRATGFQTVESSPLVGSLVSPQVEVTEVSRDKLAEAVADAAVEGNELCESVIVSKPTTSQEISAAFGEWGVAKLRLWLAAQGLAPLSVGAFQVDEYEFEGQTRLLCSLHVLDKYFEVDGEQGQTTQEVEDAAAAMALNFFLGKRM